MRRRLLLFAVFVSGLAHAQTRPKFEVASIKPCKADTMPEGNGRGGGMKPNSFSPGRLALSCTTVKDMVGIAYGSFASGRFDPFSSPSIEGGPAWINSDPYTIEAKAAGTPNEGTVAGVMLQTLLEDRFQLKIHRETRDVPVYELTVAKGGLKMPRFKEGSCAPIDVVKFVSQYPPSQSLPEAPAGLQYCRQRGTMSGPNVTEDYQATTLDTFIKFALRRLDRRVVDKTGLTGLFEIRLTYAPDETSGGQPEPDEHSNDPAGPSILMG